MVWYITFKDFVSFFRMEKKVFIWLLVCMICGSFVLNYSYSFARYRGKIYENNSVEPSARYKINAVCDIDSARKILKSISESTLPEIETFQIFGETENGYAIAGSSYISKNSASFTGLWTEGYSSEIENTGENICAVDSDILEYNGRLTMIDETISVDDEEFVIKGVYEDYFYAQIVIFADKFFDKYNKFDKLWISFHEPLNDEQYHEFEWIVKENIPHGNLVSAFKPGTINLDVVRVNELEYSVIIIMLVICLVSLIKYWHSVNLPTYTIYWINGATNGFIIGVAACESLVLCVLTYFIGLGLNAVSRNFFSKSSLLKFNDILIGFGVFFGTFLIFTLINTAKICKKLNVMNVRRD